VVVKKHFSLLLFFLPSSDGKTRQVASRHRAERGGEWLLGETDSK
jgi:hypothetical protein